MKRWLISDPIMLADVLAGLNKLLRIGDRREQDEYREEIPSKGKCMYSLKKPHTPFTTHNEKNVVISQWLENVNHTDV